MKNMLIGILMFFFGILFFEGINDYIEEKYYYEREYNNDLIYPHIDIKHEPTVVGGSAINAKINK